MLTVLQAFNGFGFGDAGFQMSFGIGAFPFGLFASVFNINDGRPPARMYSVILSHLDMLVSLFTTTSLIHTALLESAAASWLDVFVLHCINN